YIGELGAVQPVSRNVPNLGPRVTIVDNTGKRISRLGGLGPGLGPTEFLAPHGLAVDSHGDLYVGEGSGTNWPQTFRDKPRPDKARRMPKFRKVVKKSPSGIPLVDFGVGRPDPLAPFPGFGGD